MQIKNVHKIYQDFNMWHAFGFEIIVAPIYLNIEPPNKSENSILIRNLET